MCSVLVSLTFSLSAEAVLAVPMLVVVLVVVALEVFSTLQTLTCQPVL
jgi:hypothetical protein